MFNRSVPRTAYPNQIIENTRAHATAAAHSRCTGLSLARRLRFEPYRRLTLATASVPRVLSLRDPSLPCVLQACGDARDRRLDDAFGGLAPILEEPQLQEGECVDVGVP